MRGLQILAGVNILADAVQVTMGPRGRNVLLEKSFGGPTITKDGVSVAKEIEAEQRFVNMGVQMVKEVASKTSDTAGDGTTTATVLARSIIVEGYKAIAAGHESYGFEDGRGTAITCCFKAAARTAGSIVSTRVAVSSRAFGPLMLPGVRRTDRARRQAPADDPVFQRHQRLSREAAAYWIPHRSLSSGSPKARPGGGYDDLRGGDAARHTLFRPPCVRRDEVDGLSQLQNVRV